MKAYEKVYEILENMNIPYEVVEHPEVFTTEEADRYIAGKEGVPSKSLCLCNKKKSKYLLIIMHDKKRLDMKRLEELTGEKGIRFASEEGLMEKLGLRPGSVSVFGILNNREKDIEIYVDMEIFLENLISFHPNDNTKTVFISVGDMCRFIEAMGYEYTKIQL